jgi:beta-lactamase regulating signal transducer with metallopeptidase domain
MVIGSTGWDTQISKAFDSVGQLAASARALFSGKTKEVRDAQKEIREQNDATIQAILLEQSKKDTAKLESYLDFTKIKNFILRYWILFIVVIFFIFRKPVLRFLNLQSLFVRTKRKPRRRRYVSKTVTTTRKRKTGTRIVRKSKSTGTSKVRKGFSRRIGRNVYTDPAKWAAAMRRRRKTK